MNINLNGTRDKAFERVKFFCEIFYIYHWNKRKYNITFWRHAPVKYIQTTFYMHALLHWISHLNNSFFLIHNILTCEFIHLNFTKHKFLVIPWQVYIHITCMCGTTDRTRDIDDRVRFPKMNMADFCFWENSELNSSSKTKSNRKILQKSWRWQEHDEMRHTKIRTHSSYSQPGM